MANGPQAPIDPGYLLAHGWKFIQRQKQAYGWIYYWDHPDHQREDGRWYTQTQAVKKASDLRREARDAK